MQLDGCRVRKSERYQHQIQKSREMADRSRNTYRFERLMNMRLTSIDETLRALESRISTEVEHRVATAVQNILETDEIKNLINERVSEAVQAGSSSLNMPSSSSSSCTSSDSEESELSLPARSRTPSVCAECSTTGDEEPVPSCSVVPDIVALQTAPHYPNKWEFISSLLQNGPITDFKLDHFTNSVRSSLKMTSDQEVFPRMSLEEMIERDHPTTSESSLFDEKKISCHNRPKGKNLLDEEFFCLAPCCSGMRLFQAETYTFLPGFVKNRLKQADDCRVIVHKTSNGIELITPIKWQRVTPIVPENTKNIQPPDERIEEDEAEEEDPLANREIVEQLMHEYFIPTPALPLDDLVFGPYLQRVRESEPFPENLLHDLVRRVNSNLDNSYDSHQELELFDKLDEVPIDEKYGRLPFDPMDNC